MLNTRRNIRGSRGIRLPKTDLVANWDNQLIDKQGGNDARLVSGVVDNGVDCANWSVDDGSSIINSIIKLVQNTISAEFATINNCNFKANTQYLLVYNVKSTNISGDFVLDNVGVFGTETYVGVTIGENRALATTVSTISENFAEFCTAGSLNGEYIEFENVRWYEASLFTDPLTDPIPSVEFPTATNQCHLVAPKVQALIDADINNTLFDASGNPKLVSYDTLIMNNTDKLFFSTDRKQIALYNQIKIEPTLSKINKYLKIVVFKIKHNACTLDFEITNAEDVLWVFPDGSTSTLDYPQKVVGAGTTLLYCKDFGDPLLEIRLHDHGTDTDYIGDLSDIPPITHYLNLYDCSNLTGDLADLQGKITYYLSMYRCSNITGDLADLQGNITEYLGMYKCYNITGDLADLQGNITGYLDLGYCNITGDLADLQGNITSYLGLRDCTNITGDLADLQGNLEDYIDLIRCSNISGIYTPKAHCTNLDIIYLNDTGQSSAEVDQTIINIANVVTATNGELTTNARTSASDGAVATLQGKGWTVTCG